MTEILVVEDHPSARYSISRALTLAGFNVQAASDMAGGMKVIEKDRMDLLVADIQLPNGERGFDLVKLARKHQPELKVLYVTSYDVPCGDERDKILHKPISDRALLDEIATALSA